MAENAADSLGYYLVTELSNMDDLATIRSWSNLKVGFIENLIWIRDFNYAQIQSVEVKSLPSKTIFYERKGKLFKINSQLPDRVVPALLWTPIERAFVVTLPKFNHNYFGINEKITVEIVPSSNEVDAVAMITTLAELNRYIESAPGVRLTKIQWAILNEDRALLMGTPLLPLPGITFWQRDNFLLPTGFDLALPVLAEAIAKKIGNEQQWVIWNQDSTYGCVQKDIFIPLTRSSARMSSEPI